MMNRSNLEYGNTKVGFTATNICSNDPMVSNPSHYQSKSGREVIDVIEAFTEGLTGIEAFDTANIIKYACRWKNKNVVQDLEKIIWYANHLIQHLNKIEKENIKHEQNEHNQSL